MKKYIIHYVKFGVAYYATIEATSEQEAAKEFHNKINKYNECTITKINVA